MIDSCNSSINLPSVSERRKATLRFSRNCCTPRRRLFIKSNVQALINSHRATVDALLKQNIRPIQVARLIPEVSIRYIYNRRRVLKLPPFPRGGIPTPRLRILRLVAEQSCQSSVADMLGVSRQCVNQAVHRNRALARAKLHYAVAVGTIIRPTRCELCGRNNSAIEAHHPDYTHPLSVRWLCRACHNNTKSNA